MFYCHLKTQAFLRSVKLVEGWGRCGWLNRHKKNEDARNPSLYAFSFSHHMHVAIKWETRKGLLPNKNHMCETYFKLYIIQLFAHLKLNY